MLFVMVLVLQNIQIKVAFCSFCK